MISNVRLNTETATDVPVGLGLKHFPGMVGFQFLSNGEQSTSIKMIMIKKNVQCITRTAWLAQKKPLRVPGGTKMEAHSRRIAALISQTIHKYKRVPE